MALASLYSSAVQAKSVLDVLVITHFDAHGVATAAARARVLRQQGQRVRVVSRFPETGPQGLSSGAILQLTEQYAPKRIEIIDIPIDVRNPAASIDTLAKLAGVAPLYYFDHHETDLAFVEQLYQRGVYASVFGDAVSLAVALRILDSSARELAIVGIVADRDPSILKIVSREEIESKYLPLANRLDVVVRQPNMIGCSTAGDVAEKLASEGLAAIPASIEYPPERIAREVLPSKTVDVGTIAVLVDWSDMELQHSMWVPKALEQLLLYHNRYIAVAVVPGYNPRTRAVEGYDVRVLRYWLSPSDVPVPESLVKDVAQRLAVQGNVVGHADYVSMRFASVSEARGFARNIYGAVEGRVPSVVHLVSDVYVANAVRRDYQKLYDLLERIARALERGAEAKEEQVRLLRDLYQRDERTRYD